MKGGNWWTWSALYRSGSFFKTILWGRIDSQPTTTPMRVGSANIVLCRYEHIIQFLAKNLGGEIKPMPLSWVGGLASMTFQSRSGHFIRLIVKRIPFVSRPSIPFNTLVRSVGLVGMTFLCRPGYFSQFLAKKTFVNWPYSHGDGRLANKTFLYSSGHFMCFLAWNIFRKLTLPNTIRCGGSGRMKLCVHIQTFQALSIKIIFSKMATNPLAHGSGRCQASVLCICGYLMHFQKKFFCWICWNFTCCWESCYHSSESKF